MPSRQKAKGNNFERDIAKHLSAVFELNFTRVPTSGAMTGGLNADVLAKLTKSQRLLLEGDLIPPDEMYRMKIECKSLKSFSFAKLFTENKMLDSWLEQAESDDKAWFLIFKINNKGIYLGFSAGVYKTCNKLRDRNYLIYKKKYYITAMDGFFELNKHSLLRLCEDVV